MRVSFEKLDLGKYVKFEIKLPDAIYPAFLLVPGDMTRKDTLAIFNEIRKSYSPCNEAPND